MNSALKARQATLPIPGASLRERRDRLFELHSFLRSVDNLRPDEALDEIAKLFEVWANNGTFEIDLSSAELMLSKQALEGATRRLEPLLNDTNSGQGSELFQALADVGIRAGMGQYFTPYLVAQAMASFLEPIPGERWLDPFCGSGQLLGALVPASDPGLQLFGIDRDPRVLHLARVEGVLRHPDTPLSLLNANALEEASSLLELVNAPREGVDGIVANPPFGAVVHDSEDAAYGSFDLARKSKTPLEILGLEQCVRMLRPGGRLGIVLPQSVLSNRSLSHVREFILDKCDVNGVLSLPPETFLPFKGVSKASVLFLTKQRGSDRSRVSLAISRSIGWDPSGKPSGNSDLLEVSKQMMNERETSADLGFRAQDETLLRNMTAEWLLRPEVKGRPLSDVCTAIYTGGSPGRTAYLEGGTGEDSFRVLKVRDLTNHGVSWVPGDRSVARLNRSPDPERLVQVGDLATTAAAHHARYIGAKVDIIDCLPPGFEARCMPVAEVLVLRPNPDEIDPLLLLLWLRSDEGRAAIQACVTGQTAHLNSKDVEEVVVPWEVLRASTDASTSALRESLRLLRQSEEASTNATAIFQESLKQ